MSNPNFEKAFEEIILHEGGYADDPADRGGKTMYGITEAVAREHGYKGKMKDFSLKVAKGIYKKSYWNKCHCDEFDSWLTALLVFDTAVNMGVGAAGRLLQESYNLLGSKDIEVDGVIGLRTLSAVNGYNYPRDINFWFNVLRGKRYINIVNNNSTQRRFIRGWGRRLQAMTAKVICSELAEIERKDQEPPSFAKALDIVTARLKEVIQ